MRGRLLSFAIHWNGKRPALNRAGQPQNPEPKENTHEHETRRNSLIAPANWPRVAPRRHGISPMTIIPRDADGP